MTELRHEWRNQPKPMLKIRIRERLQALIETG